VWATESVTQRQRHIYNTNAVSDKKNYTIFFKRETNYNSHPKPNSEDNWEQKAFQPKPKLCSETVLRGECERECVDCQTDLSADDLSD